MLETPHVAVGAAIAVSVHQPALAIPLALVSHFVLDQIPHWNPSFFTETKKHGRPAPRSITFSAFESLTALGLGFFIAATQLPNYSQALLVIICSFAAVFSDVVKIPFFFFKSQSKLLAKWVTWERSLQVETDSVFWGIVTQLLVVAASLWWILG